MKDNGYRHPSFASSGDRFVRHTTLRQLQIMEAIVRLGSFTRAAEELFLTQPTVSMQVKKLADTVGMPLFQPAGRGVEATDAGREVYGAAREILNSLAELETRLADLEGLKRGRLRLGVITTAKYFAPEILGAFCELYPGVDVSLKVTNLERIQERLMANEDDLSIIGESRVGELDAEIIPFAPNPLVMVARRDHPLVKERNIPLSRIAQEQFLLREPGSGIRGAVMKRFQEQGLRPNVRMELGSNEAIKHAVVGGLGISALSLHSFTLEGPNGPLALLDVEGFPILRCWHLAHPRNRDLSLVAKTFLSFAISREPDIRARMESLLKEMSP
ncbi:MAG: LysR substrate-binding domain-containing protein [Gammaproteobacteria bacterium]|nr:LysR substrate-binding domain-containing protein [Gammaproteobacteria bacterium]